VKLKNCSWAMLNLPIARMELETVIITAMYEIVNTEIPELEPSNPGTSGLRKKSVIPGLESLI
jgi:hypothetical protein